MPDFYLFFAVDLICSQLGNINSPTGEPIFHGWGINIPQLGANKIITDYALKGTVEKVSSYLSGR